MAPANVNVFLFVPNIIGYVRIVLMIIAFYFMTNADHYLLTVTCYMLSQLLDAFDGHAARMLGQTSKLGAMLDQLTDRLVILLGFMSLIHLIICHFMKCTAAMFD